MAPLLVRLAAAVTSTDTLSLRGSDSLTLGSIIAEILAAIGAGLYAFGKETTKAVLQSAAPTLERFALEFGKHHPADARGRFNLCGSSVPN